MQGIPSKCLHDQNRYRVDERQTRRQSRSPPCRPHRHFPFCGFHLCGHHRDLEIERILLFFGSPCRDLFQTFNHTRSDRLTKNFQGNSRFWNPNPRRFGRKNRPCELDQTFKSNKKTLDIFRKLWFNISISWQTVQALPLGNVSVSYPLERG